MSDTVGNVHDKLGPVKTKRPLTFAIAVTACILVLFALLIGGGSYLYWRAEGSPGSPQEFRDRVAAAGLDVTWKNNGSRGGDGVVESECGARDITISDFDGELWLITDTTRRVLDPQVVDWFLACADQ